MCFYQLYCRLYCRNLFLGTPRKSQGNCHVYKFTLNGLRDRNQNCASKSGKEGFNSLQNLSTHKFSVPKGTALHGRCKRQLWRSAFNLTELDHNFTIQRRLGFDWAYFFVLNWQTRAETKCVTMLQQAEGKRCIHRLSPVVLVNHILLERVEFPKQIESVLSCVANNKTTSPPTLHCLPETVSDSNWSAFVNVSLSCI